MTKPAVVSVSEPKTPPALSGAELKIVEPDIRSVFSTTVPKKSVVSAKADDLEDLWDNLPI